MIELVFLARAISIENRTKELRFPSGFVLVSAVPMSEGVLYVFPFAILQHTHKNSSFEAEKSYETFTGRESRYVSEVEIPEHWDYVASLTHIEYESDKLNGGGTGKMEIFRHRFSSGTVLESSGYWMRISGPRLTVTEFGIEN
jgi:hypothetical protein